MNEINNLDIRRQVDLAREPAFRIAALEVRPSTREVIGPAGREVLEPRVMQVLVVLGRALGAVVTRDDLIEACWDGRAVSEDAINRPVALVRKLSEGVANGTFTLETITKVGYRLLPSADPVPEGTLKAPAEAVDPTTQPIVTVLPALKSMFSKRRLLITGAAAGVLLGAMVIFFWRGPKPPAATVGLPKIAVLPFEPLYSDPDARYFADGVASSIANELSAVGMPVVSQTQSFQYRGAAQGGAARALGAAYIVHGGVRREGRDMVISVNVDDVRSGVAVLAKEFEAPAADMTAARERIAADMASAFNWIKPDGQAGVEDAKVIAGLLRLRESKSNLDYYEASLALSRAVPDNALTLAAFASSFEGSLRAIPATERPAAVAEARADAKRAIELDPHLGRSYIGLAWTTPTYLWAEREAFYRQAGAADPESPDPPRLLGQLWRHTGRLREAESQAVRAVARDPLSLRILLQESKLLSSVGRRSEARQLLDRAVRLWPSNIDVIHERFDVAIEDRAYDAAEALLHDPATGPALGVSNGLPAHDLSVHEALLRALRSRSAGDTRALATACADASAISRSASYHCLIALSQLSDLDAAFRFAAQMFPDQRAPTRAGLETKWLETADTMQAPAVLYLPETAALRADPRFMEIARRLGLVDYWQATGKWPDFCSQRDAPYDCRTQASRPAARL